MKFKKLATKNFILQSLLLTLMATIMYGMLYLYIPRFYQEYQKSKLTENINKLLNLPEEQFVEDLAGFLAINQVDVSFYNENNIEVIPPELLDLGSRSIIQLNQQEAQEATSKLSLALKEKNVISTVKLGEYEYTVAFKKLVSSVDDVGAALILFIPYFGVTIVFLSMISSYFYAVRLTKPLISITRKTENLARLKFKDKLNIDSKDELEIIADNLNYIGDRFEKTLSKLEDEIEIERRKEQNKREFIAIMSHELKSPLTALKGQTECMISKIEPFNNRDKYLKENIILINELEDLVKEILFSSKLEDGFVITKEKIELQDLIYNEIQKNEEIIQNKKLKLSVNLQPLEVEVDVALFKKVIKNIIENLAKYADELGNCEIIIKENSIEFYNDSKNIFESKISIETLVQPFKRLDNSRNKEDGGHGLGLHIIKKIIEIHNFDLIISKKNKGLFLKIDFQNKENKNENSINTPRSK